MNVMLGAFGNFFGGIKPGRLVASTFDATISIDLQKLVGLSNALIYADLENHVGKNPSTKLVGDAQFFNLYNAAPYFELLEIWYQQKLLHGKLRLKAGKMDGIKEFGVINNGLNFPSRATHALPTNFVLPTFPRLHLGISLSYSPTKFFYTSLAAFNANSSDHLFMFYGLPKLVHFPINGLLYIGETGFAWNHLPFLRYDGNVKLGYWKHTGTFTNYIGEEQQGTAGYYVILDQTLWEPNVNKSKTRGLKLFFEYGRASQKLADIYRHYGGGIAWDGPSENHPGDAFGISVQDAIFSPKLDRSHHFELDHELFYKFNISPRIYIKPDLQYIVHPSGKYPNAFVGTLQLHFSIHS